MPKGKPITHRIGRPFHALVLSLHDNRDALLAAARTGGMPALNTLMMSLIEKADIPTSSHPTSASAGIRLLDRLYPELSDELHDALSRHRGGNHTLHAPPAEGAMTIDEALLKLTADVADIKSQVTALSRRL